MGKFFGYVSLLLLFSLSGIALSFGQPSIKSLEEQIRKLENEIKQSTQLLEKTQKDQKVNLNQLKLVRSRIDSRRTMVTSLQSQLELLQNEISEKDRAIAGIDEELDRVKADYASMVREAYKNHKLNNFALFLFAADDFNDATRRVDFMRRYNNARESKARQVRQYSDSLALEIAELNRQKEELDATRSTHTKELDNLKKDESQYSSSVNKLKQEESKISKELKAKRDQIDKAQKEIQRIIAEEAAKNKKEVRTAAEQQQITRLTGKFDDNKGKMPYPVRGGVVIDKFGKHPHPTQRNLTINNNGVNIAGERGADVNCVFEGTVGRIFVLPGYNNCVIVRHGDYMTVYANLASVAVKSGDKIALNQRIGKLSDSGNSDDVYLHFEVVKGQQHLNPEQWIRK